MDPDSRGQPDARAPRRRAGHAGNFPGVSTNLAMYLDRGFTVVVLCNQSSGIGAPGLTAKIDEFPMRLR